ncbi:MAG: tRNA glutamyl-Q(34) synthetase GluQRS [Pseudomonadota bacterium]
MSVTTRFAPSPTGPLHLGHAYSAIVAHDLARAAGGRFLLRLEDLDQSRVRDEWARAICEDLHWLGLSWDGPVWRQSDRRAVYDRALDQLWAAGLVYPCTCTRQDIRAAASAPQEGTPAMGPDGVIYPGTCRPPPDAPPPTGPKPERAVLRLNMGRLALPDDAGFEETGAGPDGRSGWVAVTQGDLVRDVGDVVLARRDGYAAYHLAVVVDDAAQGVTCVSRGQDLFEATQIHVALQHSLGLPTPRYHHHRLIRDDTGKRLAKRDDARAIRTYRDAGIGPNDLRAMVGL